MSLPIGSQRFTSAGVIGQSGAAIRVFSVILKSGGSVSTLPLLNGTSSGGTEYDSIAGTASGTVRINYAGGLLFPNGCFANADGNISYGVVIYEVHQSA